MPKPTEEQEKFFTDNNLILPPTRNGAGSLQSFAKYGNTLQNKEWSFNERVSCIRAMQEKWNGQLVVHSMRQDGKTERGLYLVARYPHEMRQAVPQAGALIKKGMEQLRPALFRLMINRAGHIVGIGLEHLCLKSEVGEAEVITPL